MRSTLLGSPPGRSSWGFDGDETRTDSVYWPAATETQQELEPPPEDTQ